MSGFGNKNPWDNHGRGGGGGGYGNYNQQQGRYILKIGISPGQYWISSEIANYKCAAALGPLASRPNLTHSTRGGGYKYQGRGGDQISYTVIEPTPEKHQT